MSFIPIVPVMEKVTNKAVDYVPLIGPAFRYAKTAKKITNFSSPVKATTYTAGLLIEICGGKFAKYSAQCAVWATTTAAGLATGNPVLIGVGMEVGSQILEDFYDV